ncbi:cytochrome d ubiquinol oxidase subunit II [Uliginosibacterium sediminicola]|uniref:Cytochrome d ubiquinol oxidase subunit II n=1 Tax=Uliginosibacterium sediminicola TaxID=2024550 RepID=A0ABU9YZG2_9RHOO
MIDYEILKLIWWLLVGVLLLGFAVMDGHDMGVGTLLPFVGKSDDERRVILNSVGPHWEGNQVWFITAGGAIFAAWPLVYAAAFSGFYFAMLAVLWALFFRPVGFDYRSKVPDARWRSFWDWGIFVGSAVPALVFGVAFGNVIQGVPFHFSDIMMPYYTGSFWALFNPFALLCGVVSLSMLVAHGANYLVIRTEGQVQQRARRASMIFTLIMLLAFALGGVMVADMPGYVISSVVEPGAAQSPLTKTVVVQAGAWLENYQRYPLTMLIPALGFIGGVLSILLVASKRGSLAFIATGIAELGIIFTAGVSIFPFVLPSSSQPGSSLTVWDCVSSQRTLGIMFWVALVMTPIIILYTSWAYRAMRGKLTVAHIQANKHSAY